MQITSSAFTILALASTAGAFAPKTISGGIQHGVALKSSLEGPAFGFGDLDSQVRAHVLRMSM